MVFKTSYHFVQVKKYCRILPLEHSAILLTFIKLPFVIKIFVLSIFEWPLKTGLTVCDKTKTITKKNTHTMQWDNSKQ